MARPRTTPQDTPVVAPAPEELLPARPVDLRRAVRLGVSGGIAAVFLSAVGMVERFSGRDIVSELALGYVILLAVPLLVGYVAGKPPERLEGFAETEPGNRNVLAGAIAGVLTGVFLALFAALINTVNIRGVFTNVNPGLADLLTFGQALGMGMLLVVVGGTALGALGGSAHLLAHRWRHAAFVGLLWVLTFGVLEALFRPIFRGPFTVVTNLLYQPGGGLAVLSAVVLFAATFGVSVALAGRRRSSMRDRFERQAASRRTLTIMFVAAAVLLIGGMLPQVLGRFLSQVMDTAGIFLLMALGLNIVVGYAGLLDLGYVAFFAVGAYTTAVLTSPSSPAFAPELTFWMALPFVILAAAVAGLMVGTPVLRMRGDYLAIVTLGFGEMARLMFQSTWLSETLGGAQGIIRIPSPSIGPIEFVDPQSFFYILLAFMIVTIYISYALQNSRIGRAWMAMREDESVAEAMGVNIVGAKLSAFVIGAILASFGGALFAAKIHSVFPHSFDVIVSITVLVVIIVGGLGSMPGVIVGALVLVALPQVLREFEAYRFLIYGALLIFMMLQRPEGFIPSRRRAQELKEEEVLQDEWLKAQQAREGDEPAPAGGTS